MYEKGTGSMYTHQCGVSYPPRILYYPWFGAACSLVQCSKSMYWQHKH